MAFLKEEEDSSSRHRPGMSICCCCCPRMRTNAPGPHAGWRNSWNTAGTFAFSAGAEFELLLCVVAVALYGMCHAGTKLPLAVVSKGLLCLYEGL